MLRLALANITHRKIRSLLTILAVAVGIALLLTLVGMTNGTLNEITERMQNVGADIVVHAHGWSPITDSGATLPTAYGDKLKEVEGVKVISPVVVWVISIDHQSHKIFGIDPESFAQVGAKIEITQGRMFRGGNELVIDERLAAAAPFTLGDTIERLGREFTIVGICKAGIAVRIFMPIETAQEVLNRPDMTSLFFVKCKSEAALSDVATRIETRFRALKTLLLDNFHEALQERFGIIRQFVMAVIFVTLLISLLAILISTYTSILERTREIGVLKSLGASKIFIVRHIVYESVILCIAGVIVGFGMTYGWKLVIALALPRLTLDISLVWMGIATVLGVFGGVLGAILPALIAACHDPVTALNYE